MRRNTSPLAGFMLVAVLAMLSACGASEGDGQVSQGSDAGTAGTDARVPPPQCIPGAQVSCACLSGAQGVQFCFRDGTYSDCECPVPSVDAGTRDVVAQPRAPAPYDPCAPVGTPCTNGTQCIASTVRAPDAGTTGGHTCTVRCTTVRDCPGYVDPTSQVECLNVDGRPQCVRVCRGQSDCDTSLTTCVFVAARKVRVCAP